MKEEMRCEDRPKEVILVAEDDFDTRDAFMSCIGMELPDFAFLGVANGVDALETFHRNRDRVVLVLTDNEMPGKTGHELLLDLRRLDRTLPVIMISGCNQPEFVRLLKSSGLTEFFSKPVDSSRVAVAIRQLLSA